MRRAQGFSYLGLLFFVAITAAALAALGQAWSTAAQRERERELAFRGGEIARAIESYAKAVPPQSGLNYPTRWEDLLEDRRGAKTRHHLRRLYADPFTGKADWVLIPATPSPVNVASPALGFIGVHSRSEQVLLRQLDEQGNVAEQAQDLRFMVRPDAAQGAADPSVLPGADTPGNQPPPEPGAPPTWQRPPNQPPQPKQPTQLD